MSKSDPLVAKNITEHGCHVVHVLEEEELPGFTYSIGIEKCTSQPELIVTGLNRELGHWMINEYNRLVTEGEVFEEGSKYGGFLEGCDVIFKTVEEKHYDEYFGQAQRYYGGNNFAAYQLVYPNTSGVWHWEAEAPNNFRWFIPELFAT